MNRNMASWKNQEGNQISTHQGRMQYHNVVDLCFKVLFLNLNINFKF